MGMDYRGLCRQAAAPFRTVKISPSGSDARRAHRTATRSMAHTMRAVGLSRPTGALGVVNPKFQGWIEAARQHDRPDGAARRACSEV
jgi:hypothetical protein